MSPLSTNFPKGWRVVPIDTVVFYQEGPGVRKHQYTDSGVKLLNGGNINDGILNLDSTSRYVSENEAFGKYSHFLVEEGDLLIACSGVVVEKFDGKIAYATKEHLPLCMNTSTMRFRSLDSDILDLDFFRRFLQTNYFKSQLQKLITGSAQLNFGPSHIKQMWMPLPPLAEQKRIAAILDKADAIRRKRQQAIQLADDFLRAVFLEMFGDPVTNPKGWEVKKLSEISTKILNGTTPKGGSEVYVESGVQFLRSQNVWKNHIIYDDLVYLDEKTHKSMAKSSLKHKDILMTKTGRINTENSSLGRAALFLGEDDSANINGHVYLIRLKKDIIHEFVVFILTMTEYRDYIRSVCVGGIDKRQINKEHLEDFPIILPPKPLQEKFFAQLNQIRSLGKRATDSLADAEEMFNGLSHKAFSGQL